MTAKPRVATCPVCSRRVTIVRIGSNDYLPEHKVRYQHDPKEKCEGSDWVVEDEDYYYPEKANK